MISIIEFKTEYRMGGKKAVDWVCIAPKGEGHLKTQTWHRVTKLIPPESVDDNVRNSETYRDMEAKWSIIGPAYDAWKKGAELPETGTPLGAWSGVTPDMAKAFYSMGIKTVEDVAAMGDGAVSKLPFPQARKMPGMAKQWLEGQDIAARDAENEELKERLAAMEELLAERMASEQPKKRGRPKKAESEAA